MANLNTCMLCGQAGISDLEAHLKARHGMSYQQLLQLLAGLQKERKLKTVKRLINQKT